jgi:class 3 adenylate cyclase
MLTVLSALGRFPREEVFEALTDYFFHSDREISEAALRSSAHAGNRAAVPHLVYLVERAQDPGKKKTALEVLAAVSAPQAMDCLLAYFTSFTDPELKASVLKTLGAIRPRHERVLELNRGVLTQGSANQGVLAAAVRGLVAAEDFDFLEHYLVHAPGDLQLEAFRRLLCARSTAAAAFLRRLGAGLNLDQEARGVYLAAQLLNEAHPGTQSLLDELGESGPRARAVFLRTVYENAGHACSPRGVLKLMLMLPFSDREIERSVDVLIDRLLCGFRELSPGSVGGLATIVSAHLDAVFKKVRATFISVNEAHRSSRGGAEPLPLQLAHLLQKYCPSSLLSETLAFFQDRACDLKSLIRGLSDCLGKGSGCDAKAYRACLPLFQNQDSRLQAAMMLRRVDPRMPVLLARLGRLVRTAGALHLKDQLSRMRDIYEFAVQEKVLFLEQAAAETLCRLGSREILQEARQVFAQPACRRELLPSFIRGARHLPAELIAEGAVRMLFHPELSPTERDLVLETLEALDLSSSPWLAGRLLDALEDGCFDDEQKKRVAGVVAAHGERALVGRLTDLLESEAPLLRRLAVRMIREIERGCPGSDRAVVVERLYGMLEDSHVPVRVEALGALLALEDDYADRVASDWVESGDPRLVAPLLERLPEVMGRRHVPLALRAVRSEDPGIQVAAGGLLDALSGGGHADAVREGMLGELGRLPDVAPHAGRRPAPDSDLFLHAKREFQLRRDHSQELAVLFIDMVGFSDRSSRADMSGLMHLVRSFEDMVIPSLLSFNGRVVKKLGDGVLAVFTHPVAAVVAALEIQARIQEYNITTVEQERFSVRVGAHHGQVMWREGDVFGDVVNMAARMQEAAAPGEVLCTAQLHERVRDYVICEDRGQVRVKGREGPIPVFQPRGVVREVRAVLETRYDQGKPAGASGPGPGIPDAPGEVLAEEAGGGKPLEIEALREAFFVPRFELPEDRSGQGDRPGRNGVEEVLRGLFTELSADASEWSRDARQEYLFRRFLQRKWKETLDRLRGK